MVLITLTTNELLAVVPRTPRDRTALCMEIQRRLLMGRPASAGRNDLIQRATRLRDACRNPFDLAEEQLAVLRVRVRGRTAGGARVQAPAAVRAAADRVLAKYRRSY